jgi:ATP-dependent DNA helicase RecG
LAEDDLRRRGPGEFIGEAQHGLPALKAGDLVRDTDLIQEARDAAFALTSQDQSLQRPEDRPFLDELRRLYAGRLFFGRVA